MKKRLRLSQCMIVKNEEKNIRKALAWGKDIMYEQIVVDTGSTDQTVSIAKSMGARVLNFKWIDDFAAAKNFAIEQASGDWIVFFDADEYFLDTDTQKLLPFLLRVDCEFTDDKKPHIVRCRWVHLNDQGIPFTDSVQDRIFRNLPNLRYHGRIHEQLALPENKQIRIFNAVDTFSIMHTGYSASSYAATNKVGRNIKLLKKELESCPENGTLMFYYAESLMMMDRLTEAETYLRNVVKSSNETTDLEVINRANQHLLRLLVMRNKEEDASDVVKTYQHLLISDPKHPDAHYFFGIWLINNERLEEAKLQFEKALEKLEAYQGKETVHLTGNLEFIYLTLTKCCFALGMPSETVRYGVLTLRINRYQEKVLEALLSLLREETGEKNNPEGTLRLLNKLYDFQSLKDELFILKCAKSTAFTSLENKIISLMPEAERISIQCTK